MIKSISIIQSVSLIAGALLSIDARAVSNCVQRRELNQMATRAGYAPNLFLRMEGQWTEADDIALPQYDRRRGEVGLEYSIKDLRHSKISREISDLECVVPRNSIGSNQYADALQTRAKIARLNAEIAQLSIHMPKVFDFSKILRDRYLSRSVNVIDFDNSLARLQRLNKMLSDRKAESAYLQEQFELENLPAGPESRAQIADASRRHLELSQSLASLDQWDLKLSLGRRAAISQNDDQYTSNFAKVELNINLGAPINAFRKSLAMSAQSDLLGMRTESLQVEMQLVDDRLKVVEDALTRTTQTHSESDPKTMEIFVRWLELKTESVGIRSELETLGGSSAPSSLGDRSPRASLKPDGESFQKVSEPTYRKAVPTDTPDRIAIRFRLSGITNSLKPLGSGDIRDQLGLMLRHTNQCNLVYAMLRVSERKIVVQEKVNPGKSTHDDCQNDGYMTVAPRVSAPLPILNSQQAYELSASIEKDEMTVALDGEILWRGPAPKTIQTGTQHGFRSDNLNVEYRFLNDRG